MINDTESMVGLSYRGVIAMHLKHGFKSSLPPADFMLGVLVWYGLFVSLFNWNVKKYPKFYRIFGSDSNKRNLVLFLFGSIEQGPFYSNLRIWSCPPRIGLNLPIGYPLWNVNSQMRHAWKKVFKGIDRPFPGGVKSNLIRSLFINWRLGNFFLLILKGFHHKISKKPIDAA